MPPEGIDLFPIGDIHEFNPMFSDGAFDMWCERCMKSPNAYFFGMGDYIETFSVSERKALLALHDSSKEYLDEQIEENIEKFSKKLEFTKGRWLGMLSGNHNYITDDGKTTTQMMAERLGARALGVAASVVVNLRRTNTSYRRYTIWAHHGKGGGELSGSALNSLEKWANAVEGDLVMMGHAHKIPVDKLVTLRTRGTIGNLYVDEHIKTICRTGSFLRGYLPGKTSYIARTAKRPVYLGAPKIHIQLCRSQHNDSDELNVITEVTI